MGIPVIGCDCEVCTSEDPRDKRLRTSAVIHVGRRNFLIDATPDLRTAALNVNLRRVDAVLITHTHADHIFGLDDIRRFNQIQNEPIALFCSEEDQVHLEKVFGYSRVNSAEAFRPDIPQLTFNAVNGSFDLFGTRVDTVVMPHGRRTVLGFRIGPIAYCTDLSGMPEAMYAKLADLEVLVLGALRPQNPHPNHLTMEQAIEVAQRVGAKCTYFVHMAHQVAHGPVQELLPAGIHLAHDGLRVDATGS